MKKKSFCEDCSVDEKSTSCESFEIKNLSPNTKYSYEYSYYNSTQSLKGDLKTFPVIVTIDSMETEKSISISIKYFPNIYKSCEIFYKIFGSSDIFSLSSAECKKFDLVELIPNTKYSIDIVSEYVYDNKMIVKTKPLIPSLSYEQNYMNKIDFIMNNMVYTPGKGSCKITFDKNNIKCENICPTDCQNFNVIIFYADSFKVLIESRFFNETFVMEIFPRKSIISEFKFKAFMNKIILNLKSYTTNTLCNVNVNRVNNDMFQTDDSERCCTVKCFSTTGVNTSSVGDASGGPSTNENVDPANVKNMASVINHNTKLTNCLNCLPIVCLTQCSMDNLSINNLMPGTEYRISIIDPLADLTEFTVFTESYIYEIYISNIDGDSIKVEIISNVTDISDECKIILQDTQKITEVDSCSEGVFKNLMPEHVYIILFISNKLKNYIPIEIKSPIPVPELTQLKNIIGRGISIEWEKQSFNSDYMYQIGVKSTNESLVEYTSKMHQDKFHIFNVSSTSNFLKITDVGKSDSFEILFCTNLLEKQYCEIQSCLNCVTHFLKNHKNLDTPFNSKFSAERGNTAVKFDPIKISNFSEITCMIYFGYILRKNNSAAVLLSRFTGEEFSKRGIYWVPKASLKGKDCENIKIFELGDGKTYGNVTNSPMNLAVDLVAVMKVCDLEKCYYSDDNNVLAASKSTKFLSVLFWTIFSLTVIITFILFIIEASVDSDQIEEYCHTLKNLRR